MSSLTATTVGTLANLPEYRGYEWNGKQYIPQGTHGYQSHNGVTIDAQVTTVKAVDFTEWDNKLIALCADHTLKSTTDGTTWSTLGTFNTSAAPRRLARYINASEEDTIYFSTSKGLLAWNHDASVISTTRIYGPEAFPPHPDNGWGLCMWKPGEDLFMSVGMDVLRWNLNAVSSVQSGLNRDEGIPPEYRGAIIDLVPGHRYMYALIRGQADSVETPPESGDESDPGMLQEGDFLASQTAVRNIVMGWNGYGWHAVQVPTTDGEPSWMVLSQAQGEPRLWWGVGGLGHTVRINRAFLNLRAQMAVNESRFQPEGYIESARFDAGKAMFDKILSHVEVFLSKYDRTDLHNFVVNYRTDKHDWSGLDFVPVQEGVLTIAPFNIDPLADGNDFARGEVARWVQFRWSMLTGNPATTPIMDFCTLKYITRPLSTSTFTLHLPLVGWKNLIDPITGESRGPQTIKEDLDALAISPGFVRLVHNGMSEHQRSHRVYLSRVTGSNAPGINPDGMRIVSLVQVPLAGYEGNDVAVRHG